jgi:hypothetical protein
MTNSHNKKLRRAGVLDDDRDVGPNQPATKGDQAMDTKVVESRNGFDLVCYVGTIDSCLRLVMMVQDERGRTLSSFQCDPGDYHTTDEVASMARASFNRIAGEQD